MNRPLLLAATLFALAPCAARAYDATPVPLQTQEDLTIAGQKGASHVFHVEVALTPEQQEQGLMFRTKVPDGTGMLFVFPSAARQAFWMKNTLVPLDMLFIDTGGTIIHIHENARPNDLTPVPSEGMALAVLELAGGTAAKLGIHEGDRVRDGKNFTGAR